MKRFLISLTSGCLMAMAAQLPARQDSTSPGADDVKHILTTMPEGKGRVRLVAKEIDKEWATSIVHLRGDVRVEIWTTTKYPGHATVLYADEVDYHEDTGEISPRGHVRLLVEDAK